MRTLPACLSAFVFLLAWSCASAPTAHVPAPDDHAAAAEVPAAVAVPEVAAPAPAPAPASSITAERSGFSPTSAVAKDSLELLLSFGSKPSLRNWRVDIRSAGGGTEAVRSFSGSAPDIPDSLRWDGKDVAGSLAPQGGYFATLAVDYGNAYRPSTARSEIFSLVSAPPSGSISIDPASATLSRIGPGHPAIISIDLRSPSARVANWIFEAYDPSRGTVLVLSGDRLHDRVAWDGRGADGQPVFPGSGFIVVARVLDEYGNIGTLDLDARAWEKFFAE